MIFVISPSLPAWECGLKYCMNCGSDRLFKVTPCVGVWIEIFKDFFCASSPAKSLPAWECGLKSDILLTQYFAVPVTPCVGVWIEIYSFESFNHIFNVTPCVGVWIEISSVVPPWSPSPGHSLRGSVD